MVVLRNHHEGGILALGPVLTTLFLGQVDVFIWLAVAAAAVFPGIAGFALAGAGLLKLFPAWVLAAAVARDGRTIRQFAGCLIALTLLWNRGVHYMATVSVAMLAAPLCRPS